jgi:2-polyprenyl-6-methoxyphenol hydroxylase-like FAD-dependent oxidoreductase
MTERTAVIVGGGIGGLAAAAGLHRRGWTVRVLERAPEFTEVGAGISLWPNAFTALATLGVPGPGEDRIGVAGGLRDWRGRWIVRMDDTDLATRHTGSAVVAHRAELLAALLDRVPAECRMSGTAVHGVRLDGRRAVVSYQGGELEADLVVGADGMRSAVRASLWRGGEHTAEPPVYSGQTAWRMVLPRPAVRDVTGVRAWAETWGPGGVFGLFPMSGDRVYCYATATVPAGGDGGLAELRERFRDWCDPIPRVLAAAAPEHVLRNDIHYLPRLRTYTHGPVVLLGDAAHAMTPNLGQGGCQALEDAATLSVLASGPDLAAALRRYDELRRPRTQELWKRSLQGGRLSHLVPAPARVARNAVLRALPRSVFLNSLARPFSWQPPAVEVGAK